MTKARTLADNFAADINGITAGTGITGGGTSGTVTVTNSMATAIDAKGDLVVGTGADTFSRLAVASTAGFVLTVDSAEATGLKWASAGAGFVGCSLYRTGTSQSYASNTNVIVTFNNEDYDTDGFHSNTTNTSRITIPTGKGGKYRFYYRGFVSSYNSSNYINVGYWVNGVDTLYIVNYPNTSWSEGWHQGEFITNLNAGDYVEVAVNQASGSTKDMRTDSYFYQRFYCQYLGA
jgi:hypothetical protein